MSETVGVRLAIENRGLVVYYLEGLNLFTSCEGGT